MTRNSNEPGMVETSRVREDRGGRSVANTVTQTPGNAQQTALFAAPAAKTAARPLVLVTRGRTEFLARCPNCRQMHRHVHLGDVTGACGATYQLQPKAKRKGAA
ncbi:hypothetical protein PV396_41935 [Streptomyces sp. ME02-8801-2C]|uniref:hypothetical protein n=1 Tax=Streptomyces sp. ME02-8801-2C TaxID=3028680 RepID=UPI0029BC6A38|nr:hypothetical protein [Streptomyces sp. ME02-8801-2C]MDX3458426.1 hypothetical protein [Streptomyces sp. ME02-8801-2C]